MLSLHAGDMGLWDVKIDKLLITQNSIDIIIDLFFNCLLWQPDHIFLFIYFSLSCVSSVCKALWNFFFSYLSRSLFWWRDFEVSLMRLDFFYFFPPPFMRRTRLCQTMVMFTHSQVFTKTDISPFSKISQKIVLKEISVYKISHKHTAMSIPDLQAAV